MRHHVWQVKAKGKFEQPLLCWPENVFQENCEKIASLSKEVKTLGERLKTTSFKNQKMKLMMASPGE